MPRRPHRRSESNGCAAVRTRAQREPQRAPRFDRVRGEWDIVRSGRIGCAAGRATRAAAGSLTRRREHRAQRSATTGAATRNVHDGLRRYARRADERARRLERWRGASDTVRGRSNIRRGVGHTIGSRFTTCARGTNAPERLETCAPARKPKPSGIPPLERRCGTDLSAGRRRPEEILA